MSTNESAVKLLTSMGQHFLAFAQSGSRPIWRSMVLTSICVAFLGACDRQAPPAALSEGRPFPSTILKPTAGNPISIASYQGKMVILNVWATWCPPCRREMPSLERLSQKLDQQRFVVLGLSTDADEHLATEFLLQNEITFSNFLDRNGKLAKQWGLKVYPETFLIAPNGTLVQRIVGLREWDSPATMAELETAYQRHSKTTH